MKFSSFFLLNVFNIANALPQHTDLNSDMIQLISNFTDDKTTFVLSTVSQSLFIQTQSRINRIKLDAVKRYCPNQYLYLTQHGQSILQNSYIPDASTFDEVFVMYHSKKAILEILNQKQLCMQSLLMAKHLISNRLDSISISLPAYSASRLNQFGRGLYDGTDKDITLNIQNYFASITRLVDTGLIKKIKIESAKDTFCSLHLNVERILYRFLSTLKVEAMHFGIFLMNRAAFNQFASEGAFAHELFFQAHDSTFILPIETKKLKIQFTDCQLQNAKLPNLKAVDVISQHISDLTLHRPQLEKIVINYIRYDYSFFNTICSKNNKQIKDLSLILQSSNFDLGRLKSCLMMLKPTLIKLTFLSFHAPLTHFWNDFANDFLQNNSVLKDLSLDLGDPDLYSEEVNFLQTHYNHLALENLDICIDGKEGLIGSIVKFISTHTSLKGVSFSSNSQENIRSYLAQLFIGVRDNPAIKDIGLAFEVRLEKVDVDGYMLEFAETLRVFEGRDIKVNGVAVANVIRDFSINQGEYFSCYREFVGDKCVMVFAPMELKNDAY